MYLFELFFFICLRVCLIFNEKQRRFKELHLTRTDKFKPYIYPKNIVLASLLLLNSIKFHFTKLLSTDPVTTHPFQIFFVSYNLVRQST